MKKIKKIDMAIYLLLALVFVQLVVVYPKLPQIIPTHWNFRGELDGHRGKSTIWFLYALTWFVYGTMVISPKIDPKKENYAKFENVYDIFKFMMVLFMVGMIEVTLKATFDPTKVNMGQLVPMMVSVLIIMFGNYLPKCKHNYMLGIRTPWTLASEEVWNKTHRFSGPVWVIGGLVSLGVCVFFGNRSAAGIISFISMSAVCVISVAYSYIMFKKGN
ncbi:MAG: SdpI family protein [Oscillospiraceae bacterium]